MKVIALFYFILFILSIWTIVAGTCWVKRMQNGKCKQPMARNVSKNDCCAAGNDVGFTERDLNEFEFFFATAIGDGTSCSSCIGQFFFFLTHFEFLSYFSITNIYLYLIKINSKQIHVKHPNVVQIKSVLCGTVNRNVFVHRNVDHRKM